jgi:phosphoglycerate dehydrogenase-like enzyme
MHSSNKMKADMKIAVLDDYHNVSQQLADWSDFGPSASVHVFTEYLPDGPGRVSALQPFDVIVAMRERTPFPRALIEALPNLRLLVSIGVRNPSIDAQACSDRGIALKFAKGQPLATHATAELTWAHILALFKNLTLEDASMRRGNWQTSLMPLTLAGRRLGVIGLGRLGKAVGKIGKAFDMDVVAWSPNLDYARAAEAGYARVDKKTLFSTCDVISVHMVLGESTRNVVDATAMGWMKPTAFLVNTSRAGLVDQDALYDALRHERMGGAGMDVYPIEPLPSDHRLRSLPNVTLTPHVGYVSRDNFEYFYKNCVNSIKEWIQSNA